MKKSTRLSGMAAKFLPVLFLSLGIFPLAGLELRGLEFHLGAQGYLAPERKYTPGPLASSLGAAFFLGLPVLEGTRWEFVPEMDVFLFAYRWYADRAVPAALETAGRVPTIHLLLSPTMRLFLYSDPADRLEVGLSFAPALLFRIGLSRSGDVKNLYGYWYGGGRFFYPSFGGYLRWRYGEKLYFTFDTAVYLPLVHAIVGLSADHKPALWDQMMLKARIGIYIPLE